MKNLRKLIFLSLLLAMGLVLGLFESMFPLPVAVPGARLGLSNMVVLVTIVVFGYREGLVIAVLKSVLLVLVAGNPSSFLFSFVGTMLSAVAMILSHRYLSGYISLIGISEIGSFFHNTGQIIAASIMLGSAKIIVYLPFLILLGLFTGYFVGLASIYISKNLSANLRNGRNYG